MITPVTVQTALVTRAVDNQAQCQSISSRMSLCPGDIITIVAIGLVVVIVIGCTAWSLQMFNRRGCAVVDEEQGDPHNVNPVSVENVVHGPNNPEPACSMSTIELIPVKSTEPDVFWSPQDQLPVLHFHLDPLPSTVVLEMTTMRRFRSAVRRFSWPAPATPSPRSNWASYSNTTLL